MVEWAVAGSFYDPVKPADGVLTCFIRGLFPLFSRGWFPGDGVWRVRVRPTSALGTLFQGNSVKEGAQSSLSHAVGIAGDRD